MAAPHLLAGRTVGDLTIPGEAQIIAISRGGSTFLPSLSTRFQDGDLIHLSVLATSIERLKTLLELS